VTHLIAAARGRDGKNGGKLVYRVPIGTLVYELKTIDEVETKHLLGDLDYDKKLLRIAKGGEHGKGNKRFPTLDSSHRKGKPGQ
jgi:GTPase involved in cell partitioning and DNA repair